MDCMFYYDGGLKLTRSQLAVDFRRRQARCFVSHAHADHMARHEMALATPATACLYRHRLGARKRVLEMPFGQPLDWGHTRLTAYPAGHCLGSAMLLAECDGMRLLYTGDFKLGGSLTAEPADPPPADILVMESTFGRPRYRLPPREEVIEQLLDLVQKCFAEGKTPVIHAYALGKSQEVSRILTRAGIGVLQHPTIYAVSEVYAQCGMDLGDVGQYAGHVLDGHAVVTLPQGMAGYRLPRLGPRVTIAVTGWAIDPGTRFRWGVDHALPLSDHADFDELIETVQRVSPRTIYCTHGPVEFVDHLRDRGWDARPLAPASRRQQLLF